MISLSQANIYVTVLFMSALIFLVTRRSRPLGPRPAWQPQRIFKYSRNVSPKTHHLCMDGLENHIGNVPGAPGQNTDGQNTDGQNTDAENA